MFLIKHVKYKNILNIQDLKIESNKIICVVGKSGSGKTTLLKMLNKMINPTSGDIYYNGKNLKEINSIDLRRNIAMLNQTPAIFNGTLKENLLIGRKFSEKDSVPDEEIKKILNMLKLDKSLDANSDELSGGEKQRISLGRVILTDPSVFLLDEPSSALDSHTENLIIQSLIDYTKKTNKTLIMVTHSKDIAIKFSDIIIQIEDGKVIDMKERQK